MAGNTRGKLKEHLEGIHRNFDWIKDHILKSLNLLEDKKPDLSEALSKMGETVDTLDDLSSDIYQKL